MYSTTLLQDTRPNGPPDFSFKKIKHMDQFEPNQTVTSHISLHQILP
jgi:hypothetical protein